MLGAVNLKQKKMFVKYDGAYDWSRILTKIGFIIAIYICYRLVKIKKIKQKNKDSLV